MQVHAERQNWCTVREHTWNCAEEIGQVLVWNQTKPAGGFQVTWATVVCGGYAGYQSDKQNEAMIKKGCRETAGSQALRVARWVVDAARRQGGRAAAPHELGGGEEGVEVGSTISQRRRRLACYLAVTARQGQHVGHCESLACLPRRDTSKQRHLPASGT